MQIVSTLRSASVATVLVVASLAYAPAFAQSQAPAAAPATAQQATGVYSGKEDTAAKQGPEGCQSTAGALQAQTPEQLAKALQQKPSPYDGKADDAAKDAVATCGGQ